MSEPGFRIGPTSFTTAAGTANVTLFTSKIDISRRQSFMLEMFITAAATDSVDTIAARLQFSRDGTFWDTVAYTDTVLGNATVSAAAPEIRRVILSNRVYLDQAARVYEPGASAGATDVAAASVRDEAFPGRVSSGGILVPSWRVRLVVVDGNSNSAFTGYVTCTIT